MIVLSLYLKRISRYPLFLSAILDNTEPECEERKSLEGTTHLMTQQAIDVIINHDTQL